MQREITNMTFDYNSTRPKLILAEYGRNVQNMVDYICSLPTKEERNRLAQVVIDMMGVLNPHLRDVSDFKHKLWDHLQIISDFKIDVDSPYPVHSREDIRHRPEQLNYPQHTIRYKHYGHTVEQMIEKAKSISDEEVQQRMAFSIANFMKLAYMTWNKDSVNDDVIIEDLVLLSNGALRLPEGTILTKADLKAPAQGNRAKTAAANPTNNYKNNNNSNSNNNFKRQNGSSGGPKKSFSGGKKPYTNNNYKK